MHFSIMSHLGNLNHILHDTFLCVQLFNFTLLIYIMFLLSIADFHVHCHLFLCNKINFGTEPTRLHRYRLLVYNVQQVFSIIKVEKNQFSSLFKSIINKSVCA